ncbi:Hsp70 family protein [Dactylosporangium sp. AC04546]|uniref:Hsp70 family protein n=1 Tax=Dactylosporangium sp. AC04546 TaxID=2862460 RepID=UPI002E7C0DE3|nr:Hsp70 family protein [Dactylosporangium sp. AC04546]WVK80997.1 Hsp70 family protein [Dactylosporangium sp. AC04546]
MRRLATDFGTSNTVGILTGPDGRTRPLIFDASPLLPSAVFAATGGALLVGADAQRAAMGDPGGFEGHPKRRIDDGVVWLGGREHAVVDLVAAVLTRVAGEAARVVGRPPDEVVLTHPAAWGRTRLGILADAAARARLAAVSFVPEPVAAAAYFDTIASRPAPPGCLVVYDLGAGTFDVTVVRPAGPAFEILGTDGLTDVGGLDLDAAVVAHARALSGDAPDAWQRLDRPQNPADQQARQLLWEGARAVKEQLSRHATGDLLLPVVDRRLHLTREEFDTAARPYLDRTAALTLTVLRSAGVDPTQVAAVFLVGGSSRVPLAATVLHRALRVAPTVLDQPELVVAEGALLTGHTRPSSPTQPPPSNSAARPARPPWQAPAPAAPPTTRRTPTAASQTAPNPTTPHALTPTGPTPPQASPSAPGPGATATGHGTPTGAVPESAPQSPVPPTAGSSPPSRIATAGFPPPPASAPPTPAHPGDGGNPGDRGASPPAETRSRSKQGGRILVAAVGAAILVAAVVVVVALHPWSSGPDSDTTLTPAQTVQQYVDAKLNAYDEPRAGALQCAKPDLTAVDQIRDQVKDLEARYSTAVDVTVTDLTTTTDHDTATVTGNLVMKIPEADGRSSVQIQQWRFGLTRAGTWQVCTASRVP